MSFKKKIEIHDLMMVLHQQFMSESNRIKSEKPGVTKDIDVLVNLMKSIAQLVDKALNLEV